MATSSTSSTSSSSSSSLTTSSIATALGSGSGIDMTALANDLAVAQYSSRTSRLSEQSEKLEAQVSSASNIKSMLLNLDTSLGTLVRSGSLSPTPTIANSSVASVTLSGSTTPSGSYSLEVNKLATSQRVASDAYTSSTSTVGSGTLTLRFGTVGETSFTEDTSHAAVNIEIPDGATLADVAKKINGANAGVTAYIANTVDGAQLVLKGSEGASNGFVLEATDSGSTGLSSLAWSPTAGNGELLQSAGDAELEIDGLSVTSKTNTITDAIPGVKLQLTATNTGSPTTVSFSDSSDSIASSMQDLVDALNELVKEVNSATAIGGDLANDSGAKALKKSLSQLANTVIMPNATGSANTLGDLGLKLERDGTFTLDSDQLETTMADDPDGVAAMFTTGVYGVYATIDKIYRNTSSTTDAGSLGSSISRYTKKQTEVSESQTELAEKQEELRVQLVSRFSKSETKINSINSTKTMLENQIAQWNKSE